MYQAKYAKKRRSRKAPAVLLASILLILGVTAAGTLAYLVAPTDELVNTFTPARVENTIDETLTTTPEKDVLVKENVTVKNTGDADAYIRAQIVFTWVNQDGAVYHLAPAEDTDYAITLGTGWEFKGGYYYWPAAVKPDESTGVLIEKCVAKDTEPEGYKLSVEILSQSIQAEPEDAVRQAWGFVPGSN